MLAAVENPRIDGDVAGCEWSAFCGESAVVLAAVKDRCAPLRGGLWPVLDTGGECKRCRGAILIRAMIFPCNNDSRQKSNTSLFDLSFFCNRQA